MNTPISTLTTEVIQEIRANAKLEGRGFIQLLEAQSNVPTEEWLTALGRHFHYPTLNMAELDLLEADFSVLSMRDATQLQCVIARKGNGEICCALSDPTNLDLQARVNDAAGVPVALNLVHPADLRVYLARHEEKLHALDSFAEGQTNQAVTQHVEEISLQSLGDDISPVIRLVNSTVYDAMKSGASDIHLEGHMRGMAIKYRIDGVLSLAGEVPDAAMAEQVVSRVKVLSDLDIAERRIPQDGRFKARVLGRDVDFRVSIMPSVYGEDAVIRILDKEALVGQMQGLSLESLGFDEDAMEVIRRLAAEPYGMLLVTGPTGSGKTTTLYAALSEINTGEDKIITIEDPVEYHLQGVLQIPVNEKKGLTFARGLRSILRHDPDKIMVGEIRDSDTAEIAVQSALTGHLVLTTVHANNVFDVVGRFMHMGVDPYSFVSALNGIIAQRLVRIICPACARPVTPSPKLLAVSGITPKQALDYNFMAGSGCGQCRGTGYKGRKAIAEYMILNDELRELIVARNSIRELKAAAMRSGTRSLRQAALLAVQNGQTTLQEINRGTFIDTAG
jgi:general secretion pathway protein E